jgi:hypothetical protein
MNSFEQIKALLELKEKGTISDAEFKQMLAILEAESKKEDHSESQSENIEVSDDTEEWGVRQKEAEKKLKTKAEQTTREILELHKLGKFEEAFNLFTRFERKDLFEPNMLQLLNAEKAKLEERIKRKTEANRDKELIEQLYKAHINKDFARAIIVFDQIKNKALISPLITNELAEFEKKNADDAKIEEERKRLLREESIQRRHKRQAYLIALGLAFILVFFGYCSFKPSKSANITEPLELNDTIKGEQSDTLAIGEEGDKQPEPISEHQTEYKLQPVQNPKPEPQPLPELNPKPETKLQAEAEQKQVAELAEFPDKYVTEAEGCKKTILDPTKSAAEKKVAADRIKAIKHEFVSNQNNKWKENDGIQRRLNSCYTVANNYYP